MDLFSFATNIQQMALGGVQFVNKFRKKNLPSNSNYVIYYVIGENETNPNDMNMFYLPFSNMEKMKLREFKEYFPFKGNVIFRFRLLLKDLVEVINEGYQTGLPLLKKKGNNINTEKGNQKYNFENKLHIKKKNKDGVEEEKEKGGGGGGDGNWETNKEVETVDFSEYLISDEIETKNITKQENGHYVWVDITNEEAHIPLCQGKIVAKVLFINRENYKSYDEIYFKDIYSQQTQVYNVNEKHLCSYYVDQQELINTTDNKETEHYNEKNIEKKEKEKKGDGSGDKYGDKYADKYGDKYGDIYGDRYEDIYDDRYGDRYGDGLAEMKVDSKTTNEILFTEKDSTFFNSDNMDVSNNNKLNDMKKQKREKDAINSLSSSNSTIFKLRENSANTGFPTNSVIHSNDTANNSFDIDQKKMMRHSEMRNQEEIDETENRRKAKQKITYREEKKQEQMEEKRQGHKIQFFQNGHLNDGRSVAINATVTRNESFIMSDENTQEQQKKNEMSNNRSNTYVGSSERLKELQESRYEEEKKYKEKMIITNKIKNQIDKWSKNSDDTYKDIKVILSTLHGVLWDNCNWKPVSMSELITNPKFAKKCYQNAIILCHPDKHRNKPLEQMLRAELIFQALNNSFKARKTI